MDVKYYNMVKRRILLTIYTLFISSYIFSQPQNNNTDDSFFKEFVSRNWNAESGLTGNTITDIMQDDDGYMYFGTYSGLMRFDGVDFISLNRLYDERYDFLSARTVFQDSRNHLWVGSNDEGVTCIKHTGEILKYTAKDGLPNNSIRAICEDKNNFMWIGTASGIICVNRQYILEKLVGFDKLPNGNHFTVNQLYCDTAGRMWIITRTEELYCYTGGKIQEIHMIKSIENPVVTTVAQDSTGAFWFGVAPHYVVKVVDGKETVYDVGYGKQRGTAVTRIFQDSDKNMWFALDNGITVLHDGVFSYADTSNFLVDDNINQIMEDHEKNIWLALDRGGIQKLSRGKFQTTNISSTVNAIAQDSFRNVIWMACDNGLYCYKNNKFIENDLTRLFMNIRIRHVGVTSDGSILLNCYEKYNQIKIHLDGTIEYWNKDDGLAGNKSRVSIQTKNGDIYTGTITGLSIIDHKTGEIKNIYKDNFLYNDFIMCLYEDDEGMVWFGTDGGGVYIIDPQTKEITKRLTKDDGLVGNIVFKISSVREDEIWICTGSGLSIISKTTGKITNFDLSNGFGSDGVFQVLLDYTHRVWGTSNQGIFNVKLSDLDEVIHGERKTVHLTFFSKLDGIHSGGVTSTSVSMQDDKGRLWFTLIDGFTMLDPLRNASNNYAPTVKIQSVTADNEKLEITSDLRRSRFTVNVAPKIKRLNIKYTGISFVSSEHVQFKTKLEGFEKDYSEWTKERTASFTNLKPGNYIFHVIAKNPDGIQSTNEATLYIIRKAHLWQQTWFKIVMSILIVGITFLVVVLRFRAYSKRQEEIEKLSIEVTSALAQTIDAKDKYTKGHSNRVAKYSRMLAAALGEKEKTQERIYYAALLHDIGKIGIPNAIINKPGKLTDEEYEIIKTHPVIGSDILKSISSMPEISIGARSHHERFDGKGYPDGLAGEEIPWIARIIGVADAYDAMTSNRSYRDYLPQQRVKEEILKYRGIQFDPKVADAMIKIMQADIDYVMHE